MAEFTITTAAASRTLYGYEITGDAEERAFSAELSPSGTLNLRGDEQPNAAPFVVRFSSEGNTFNDRIVDAYRLRALAIDATSVTTPRGVRGVSGILSWQLNARDADVYLQVEFAPTESGYA